MRSSQTLATVLAAVLAVLAAQSWWLDVRFRRSATRVTGTLVGFETVQVRSLFAFESELHPVVQFIDEAGVARQFTVQATAERVGVAASAPLGSELAAAVLYDPAEPAHAQLELERRRRGALVLFVAAACLLATPRLLGWAFRSARDPD